MTRHQCLQKTLRSPARSRRQLRNRMHRQRRRELTEAMIEMFQGDRRLARPAWLTNYLTGMQVHRPQSLAVLTGIQ